MLPLNGESINHSQTVIYMNRYFGQYTPSSCYWSDENTLCGENEYGDFAWNIYEVYPKQITDSRAERSEALTQELLLGYVGNDRITITVPECWENIGYFEDGHRTAEYPGEATRMPCTPGIGLLQDYYHGGAWDIQKIADVHDLYYYKEDLETLVDTEEMYVGRYKGYAVPPDPFTERGEPVTFSYPALVRVGDRVVVVKIIAYPEDPDGYYENTVLPILQSVCLHVGEGPLRITPVEDSLDGRFYTEFLLSYHGRQTHFTGKNLAGNPIRIEERDLTGDGVEEICAFLLVATDMNVSKEELHVFDGATLAEIPVPSPTAAVAAAATIESGAGTYTVTLDGKSHTVRAKEPDGEAKKYPVYGDVVYYAEYSGHFTAVIPVQVDFTDYLGAFYVLYEYKEGKMAVAEILFDKGA